MPVKDKGCKSLQPCLHVKLFFFSIFQGPAGPAGAAGPAGPRGPAVSNNIGCKTTLDGRACKEG